MDPFWKRSAEWPTRLIGKGREWLRVVAWVARDACRASFRNSVKIAVSSFAGTSAYVAACGAVLVFARGARNGGELPLAEWTGPLGPAAASFLFAGAFLLLAGLGALAKYYAARTTQRVARSYEVFCAGRLLRLLTETVALPRSLGAEGRSAEAAQQILLTGSRGCGYTHRYVLEFLISAVTFAVAVGALFSLDAALTAVLLLMMAGYGLLFISFSRTVVFANRRVSELAQAGTAEARQAFQFLAHVRVAPSPRCRAHCEAVFESGRSREYRDAFDARRLAGPRNTLLNDGFLILCATCVLVFFGSLAADGESLTLLFAYVLALRYTAHSLRQATVAVTRTNRFFPRVRPYVELVRELQQAAAEGPHSPGEWKLPALSLRGDRDAGPPVRVAPGDVVIHLAAEPLNRFTASSVAQVLADGDPQRGREIARQSYFCGGSRSDGYLFGSVREHLLGWSSSPADRESLDSLVEELGIAAQWKNDAAQLDAELDAALWERLGPDPRFALAALPGLLRKFPVLLVDGRSFKTTSSQFQQRFRRACADRLLVLTFTEAVGVEAWPEAVVAFSEQGALRGAGGADWYAAQRKRIEAELDGLRLQFRPRGGSLEDDDDLDADAA
ncbi:MAG: hypothetical protein WD069_12150 [Planctomycetales bacterium]